MFPVSCGVFPASWCFRPVSCVRAVLLNVYLLRNSIKKWIDLHFYPSCAAPDPDDDMIVIDLMENFVAFVWADYTANHKPVIPALTNVGRFIFTYIWRMQHSLMR